MVGVVVLGDALTQASLNVRTMAKDGTSMTVVDRLREMTSGRQGI
jgi:hypothetical protein